MEDILLKRKDVQEVTIDKHKLGKFENNFVYKTSNNKPLIPQFWWGNINEPSIVILGKNPSYRSGNGKFETRKGIKNSEKNDDIDNNCFIDQLKQNINRKKEGDNGPLFSDSMIDSYVRYWWDSFFKILLFKEKK